MVDSADARRVAEATAVGPVPAGPRRYAADVDDAAPTPEDFVSALPDERRDQVEVVRDVVRSNLRPGFEETVTFGMLGWVVPLSRYPGTYNGHPLGYVSLAAQKRHDALYLSCLYADPDAEREFRERWTAGGRRLDMGRSCLRYRRVEDLDLPLVAEVVGRHDADSFITLFERARGR